MPSATAQIGRFEVDAALISHPGSTVGYRISAPEGVVAYLSDHEPAMGARCLRLPLEWTSGHGLAEMADLLIHDAQYTEEEYAERIGWGHSSVLHAIQFAQLARTKHLVAFHDDPAHDDATIDSMIGQATDQTRPALRVTAAQEGGILNIGKPS